MTFLELQNDFFKHLRENPKYDQHNIPDYEVNHIIAIVKYIDETMDLNNERISIVGAINTMRMIIKEIEEHTTGVRAIDGIVYERIKAYVIAHGPNSFPKEQEFLFYKEPPYVENFVSILSQYGGLYSYVCSHSRESLIDKNWESTLVSQNYARIYHK